MSLQQMFDVRPLIAAAMWAGLISLDFTAIGPFMISQPLVSGPLFGYLMGQPVIGIIVGGIMQLLWMDLSPIGVGIPYDATASTVLAVYWATRPNAGALSQIAIALALAVPFGFLFRWVDTLARRFNTVIMHQVEKVKDENLPWALPGGILAGILWSWIRYTVAYGAIFALGQYLFLRIAYYPRMTPMDQGLTMACILLPVAGMGVSLQLFLSDEPENRWSMRRMSKPNRKDDPEE